MLNREVKQTDFVLTGSGYEGLHSSILPKVTLKSLFQVPFPGGDPIYETLPGRFVEGVCSSTDKKSLLKTKNQSGHGNKSVRYGF